ncbi:primosomal protein N' [Candidatus Photodesmus katoptron Akat1]|uniref:Replication restart protein PriA n=1 Tax=Candidatus Photodesmus katoptron Akat1 TaxID=1236703 RepID=S3DJY6_9GAMM|nr:primosomal protein N' [Candidatus Photodesmus katoptron Akat1]
MSLSIARVVLPIYLDQKFDYLIPNGLFPVVGGRVFVPFRKKILLGIVIELVNESKCADNKLKSINKVLDSNILWSESLYSLLNWCSQFYQYSLGKILYNALPTSLRKGKPAELSILVWQLTDIGKKQLMKDFGRAVIQAKVIKMLALGDLNHRVFIDSGISISVLSRLRKKGWIHSLIKKPVISPWTKCIETGEDKIKLNKEQVIAVETVINNQIKFACYLLEGVTGSGKTEVYLNLVKYILKKGRQALVLVPEIALTSQIINRFRKRFNVPVEVIHSDINDSKRLNSWLSARDNISGIVIGTRSALLTPFYNLGIIIVDEEHDISYKQKENPCYHARDIAVMRASKENIPVILGSATPALETLYNVSIGKYHHLTLTQRAGSSVAVKNKVFDIRGVYLKSGLSPLLISKIRKHLNNGNQIFLFLNRRGFAPIIMCHECGWIIKCKRCDAYCTFHQFSNEMHCHHCGSKRSLFCKCQDCGSVNLITVGVGTEQLEKKLEKIFPNYKIIRIDRDSIHKKSTLDLVLKSIYYGEYQILIGTQMLAKGHHFPNVTLAVLLDIDSALYSSDFRASERLAQMFIQVSGRAGRANKMGEVILQTRHPEHPLLKVLLNKGYPDFANIALQERKLAMLPPYTFLTLFRAEEKNLKLVKKFLIGSKAYS